MPLKNFLFFFLCVSFFLCEGAWSSSNSPQDFCAQQLSFEFEYLAPGGLVLAPQGDIKDHARLQKELVRRSREDGFSSYFGLSFLKELFTENPTRVFRFIVEQNLGGGRMQLFLYEGTIKNLVITDTKRAEVKLSHHGKTLDLAIGPLDRYFLRED